MGFESNRGGMIRHQQSAPIFSMSHSRKYGADHFFVEVLDGLNLLLNIPHVTGFVNGFDVDEDKIIFLQGVYPVLTLASIVGVQETRDSRYKDAFEASVNAQSMNNINR